MTAPDFTATRLGQVNAANSDTALFLKVFAGEVLAAFERENVALRRHAKRTIASGKSASFPALGRVANSYHTPGTMIVGTAINQNEEVVTIDGLAIADVFIANIDEAMNHFDVRSPFSAELGRSLATLMDTNILRMGLIGAANATPTVTGLPAGTVLTYDDEATDAAELLVGKIFAAAQTLDENDAPSSGRQVFVKPAEYYSFVNATSKLVNRDYSTNNGGVDSGVVLRIAGIEVVKTNNLPTSDDSANTAIPSQYRADFQKTKALVTQSGAIGTVMLIGMGMESAYLIQNQGTLMVAKYACGHKWLRQASLVSIKGD